MFPKINRNGINTLQVNLGYKCNQSCSHCHVNAGPTRTEMMANENIVLIPDVIEKYSLGTLDLTGGAPELHPEFRSLVTKVARMGVEIIDRCNLTILSEPGFNDLDNFLATNKVTIIASLPCYIQQNVDLQRGKGVFDKSIEGLKKLNKLGYGQKDSELKLHLVYNPLGESLPPKQEELERIYRKELWVTHKIVFSRLLTITNMPINRFANQLRQNGKYNKYLNILKKSYNQKNLNDVMCKNLLSVDWQGNLYDCDFNQQLGLGIKGKVNKLSELLTHENNWEANPIYVDEHCFGCTAGSGSSCSGSLRQS